jgi:hypothetical protein
MVLDEYLQEFIEGYLLEDLHAMAQIELAPGKRHGAVGYPMVMPVLSGIEVLGVLTSRAKFSENNGAARFGEFWRQYMYPERPALQRLDTLVYDMVRHGLAHSFLAKPMVRVTKHRDSLHLSRTSSDVFVLDALTFADEFETAYHQRLRPEISGEFKANMEQRFLEFQQANWQDRVDFGHEFAKVPRRTESPFRLNQSTESFGHVGTVHSTDDSGRVNSPSLQRTYPTIISTSDFDDPNGG